MSVNGIAGSADVFSEDKLKELCPKEYEDFTSKLIAFYEGDLEFCIKDFVYELKGEDAESEEGQELLDSFEKLQDVFLERTGLDLDLQYHDSDEFGDRDDDVNGPYWEVGNVWVMTPAAEKLKEHITKSSYVFYS